MGMIGPYADERGRRFGRTTSYLRNPKRNQARPDGGQDFGFPVVELPLPT